jgi:hypothetical protein
MFPPSRFYESQQGLDIEHHINPFLGTCAIPAAVALIKANWLEIYRHFKSEPLLARHV